MGEFATLSVFDSVAAHLSRPNHAITSYSQLSRLCRVGDDKIRRAITRLSGAVHAPLIETVAHRLTLTDTGRQLLQASQQLLAVGNVKPDRSSAESLTVALAQSVCPRIVSGATAAFLNEWDGLVNLRLLFLGSDAVLDAVENGDANFGIALLNDESDAAVVPPLFALPLTALMPPDHPLAEVEGPFAAKDFSSANRVFVAGVAARCANDVLSHVPEANRVIVECPAALRQLVMDGHGIGLEFSSPSLPGGEPFSRIAVSGVEPARFGLVLPRKRNSLGEPARSMIDAFKAVASDHGPAASQSLAATAELES